jgi:hypothetical protein
MSFGKSGGTSTAQVELSPEQRKQIEAQTGFFTNTIAPTYEQAVKGATGLYESGAPGVTRAAQNLAGTASQAQQALGETGESALRTGISGLEGLFDKNYVEQQLAAAMTPAQAQYQQNLQDMAAQYGGTGNLGSARQALAQTQLAGQTQASQQAAAAGVMKDIAAQRLAAGQALTTAGQGGIGQAIGAAGQQVTAAMTPQDLYNKYASVIFGTPSASYNPNFAGTQSTTTSGNKYNAGISWNG